jgi:hypothetical protein
MSGNRRIREAQMGDDPETPPPRAERDDADLSVESLRAARPRGRPARPFRRVGWRLEIRPEIQPALARGVALVILAALMLVTAVTALRGLPGAPFPLRPAAGLSTPTATARATPDTPSPPTPTPVPTVPWGQGWVPAGPSDAQRIVFAPSVPAIGYTCAAPGLVSFAQPVPILVQTSLDRGHTWQLLRTPASGVECDLTVNPLDARDLVLATIPPPLIRPVGFKSTASDALALYRSFDGGQTWRSWPLPSASDGAPRFISYQWGWTGASLFVAPFAEDETRYWRLAASVNGQAFRWVEGNGLFTGAASDAGIVGLIGAPAALYVDIHSERCVSVCTHIMRSADNGASWSHFTPTFQEHTIVLLPGGSTSALFGQVFDFSVDANETGRNYVRSLGGDLLWDSLPSPPGNLVISHIWELPDKRIYAALDTFVIESLLPPGIYTLAPGADSWAFVASYPAGGPQSLALTWDDDGHALALWGAANSLLPDRQTGLESYAI